MPRRGVAVKPTAQIADGRRRAGESRLAVRANGARDGGHSSQSILVAAGAELRHGRVADLPELLCAGDLLVINISRTLPAALAARRADGSEVVLNLSTPVPGDRRGRWVVDLRRGGERVLDARAGERLGLPVGAGAKLEAPYFGGRRWVASLTLPTALHSYLERHGRPIGHLDGEPLKLFQPAYATELGSAECPSAGRPFTPELITALIARGIDLAPLVLHTGVSSLEDDEAPYPERYRVPAWTAERVNLARRLGGRAIAVGTTAARALESAAAEDGSVSPAAGWTDLVLGPQRPARAVDGILTGFHDRGSSHLRLLEAIAGAESVERCYREADRAGYLRPRRHEPDPRRWALTLACPWCRTI